MKTRKSISLIRDHVGLDKKLKSKLFISKDVEKMRHQFLLIMAYF